MGYHSTSIGRYKAIIQAWKASGRFLPYPELERVLVEMFCDEQGTEDKNREVLLQAADGIQSHDHVTGLRQNFVCENARLLQLYKSIGTREKLPDYRIIRIWGDFSNMNGLSTALTKDCDEDLGSNRTVESIRRADKYLSAVSGFLHKHLKKTTKDAEIYLYREGGDEIGGYILLPQNTGLEPVSKAVDDTNNFSTKLSEALGLDKSNTENIRIIHQKLG